jgi:hypothetical protein
MSKFSFLGCKYRLYPESPIKRKLIRGSIVAGAIASTPVVGAVAVVAGVGVLVVGSVALPVYGSVRLVRSIKVIFLNLFVALLAFIDDYCKLIVFANLECSLRVFLRLKTVKNA